MRFRSFGAYYYLSLLIGTFPAVLFFTLFEFNDSSLTLEGVLAYVVFASIGGVAYSTLFFPVLWLLERFVVRKFSSSILKCSVLYWIKILVLYFILALYFRDFYYTFMIGMCYALPGFFIYRYFFKNDLKNEQQKTS